MFGPATLSFDGLWQLVFRVVFTLGFGAVGLLLTLIAGAMWLVSTTATVDRDGLLITRGVLGLWQTRTLAPREVAAVAPKQTMSSGDRLF